MLFSSPAQSSMLRYACVKHSQRHAAHFLFDTWTPFAGGEQRHLHLMIQSANLVKLKRSILSITFRKALEW